MKAIARLGGAVIFFLAPWGCRRADVPLTAPELARGRRLFMEHCALCHGERGDGRGPRRLGLAGRPADFTDPEWRRRFDASSVSRAVREGVPGSSMPSWRSLSGEDVRDVAGYVLTLGGKR